MRTWSFAVVACALALAGCGDDDGMMVTDAGIDGSAMLPDAGRDAGGRDAARPDAGPGDPCATDQPTAISTVGCNGPPPGAGIAPNEFGGLCVPNATTPQGSCLATTDTCVARMGVAQGICLRACVPSPDGTYVTTSDCPMGSRCFTFDDGMGGGVGVCYPDCTMPSECTSMGCDGEGSCTTPAMVFPTGDGGVGDAGVPTDAGVPDDGSVATDAGVPVDAGPDDAGVPAVDAGTDAG